MGDILFIIKLYLAVGLVFIMWILVEYVIKKLAKACKKFHNIF